jgi:NAD(P)H-flavin reductase
MSGAPTAAIAENPWLAQSVRIDAITTEIPGVATYHLRFAQSDLHQRYRFLPGQFNMLYLPGAGEIAISLSAGAEHKGTWDHTIRVAGNATRTLARLGLGGSLGLRGPYGTSWPLDEYADADVVFVAGGIGLAPLRPAIHERLAAKNGGGRTTLLYGARTADMLLYGHEYREWLEAGLDLQTTVDRAAPDWKGNVGVVPLLLDRLTPCVPSNTVLLMCGPEVMMRYTVRSALHRGIPPDRIWVSLERNMQCAVGFCGHCQLGPAFVCKDGPVFRWDQIEPYLDVEAL